MGNDDSTLMPRVAKAAPRPDDVVTLTIAYHPDIERIGERARFEGNTLELSRLSPDFTVPGADRSRPLEDRYLSRSPVLRLARSGDTIHVEAPSSTPVELDGRPLAGGAARAWQVLGTDELQRGAILEIGGRVVVVVHLARPDGPRAPRYGLVGDSDAIEAVRHDIARVSDLTESVLIRGETGTGKELVARAIHDASPRAVRPFRAINVATLLSTTAQSALFGHARGGFTGATADREGAFASADTGTLFLDEVGELPHEIQPMLLRVLETREVEPVGSERTRKVDVRLLSATDADLEQQITESGFREALYHRLASYQLLVPPLRDRRDDIGRLLAHFLVAQLGDTGDLDRLRAQATRDELWLPSSLVARLVRYAWPGNVRQLRNAVRQLAIANRGAAQVRPDPVLERLLAATRPPPPAPAVAPARRDPASISDDDLVATLERVDWSPVAAAQQLGVSRSSLYVLIDRSSRIRKAKDLSEAELRQAFADSAGELDVAARELKVSRRALKLRWVELGLT